MGKIYGYARVSTVHQDLEVQLRELERFGVDVLIQEKASGKDILNRPEFCRMLKILESGDTVVVYKLDRLGRSISDVVKTYESFKEKGIYLVSLSEGIDTRRSDDIMTKAMVTLFGLFAEIERNTILERTMAGRMVAKQKGVKFGRKPKDPKKVEHAIKLWLSGEYTVSEIEEITTVPKSTLYREIQKRGLKRETTKVYT